jgi:regulator of sigma E protease
MANFMLAIAIFAAFFAIVGIPQTPPVVKEIAANSAAARAGLAPDDRIVAMNGRGINSFEDIAPFVALRPNQLVSVEFVRDGQRLRVPARIASEVETDRFGQRFVIGRLGVAGEGRVYAKLTPLQLLPAGASYTLKMTRLMTDGLWQIISGRRSLKEIGGPLKIAQVAGQRASLGAFEFINLVALVSINLGFINLLPVPLLDGGHLFFYGIEAIRRRPVGLRVQDWAFRGGLALILALMVFTTVNDLASFGLWDRLGRLIG